MQRRLDVAMGLIHRPQVLFMDEPTTGLDPEVRAMMWTEIEGLSRTEGITVLLTTHYLEEADHLAERLAIIDRGRVVVEGSPDELKGQLHGDAISVELRDGHADGNVTDLLRHLAGVSEVTVDGRSLRARVDNGATAAPTVLTALEGRGVPVASITVSRPSLDDVYLRYAGRSYNQADEPAEEKR
jgi:ABC-2 type transport system ATP-binding protein